MRAFLTVYEPGDDAHPSLPTLREFIDRHQDHPATRLVRYEMSGTTLAIDPLPLRQLPVEYLEYRVSPGSSFVTFEALKRKRT